MDKLYFKLVKDIKEYPTSRITLDTLYSLAEGGCNDANLGIHTRCFETAFEELIGRLVDDNILKPIKASKPNHRGLYPKYQRINTTGDNDSIRLSIINTIKKPMDINYYLTHPKDFLQDRQHIELISQFFQRESDHTWVTVNERSYELFGDEKYLKGTDRTRSRGETLLYRLGLTYDDLFCRITLEPFFCFLKSNLTEKHHRSIYIIENKDTFWSFKNVAYDHKAEMGIDMLIYGEGKKILSSFQFVKEFGLNINDDFFYFGDLDPEGINIFVELMQRYNVYTIKPYVLGYEQLLLSADAMGIKAVPKEQNYKEDCVYQFIQHFDQRAGEDIKSILSNGGYIPQEAFSTKKMWQVL